MEERDIDELKKGVSFKIRPTLLEEEEFFNVNIECTNPAFITMLRKFATKTTKEERISDIKFERYKIKAVLGSTLNKDDTLLFSKPLIDTGKVVLTGVTSQGLQDIKRSFDRVNSVLERMVAIIFEERKDKVYTYSVEIKKIN